MNEALITHILSISNGMYIAIALMMFFAALSYVGESRVNGLAKIYGLLCIVIIGFWFYSIFWQYFHSPEIMPYYPRWLYQATQYGTLLACAFGTFTYIRVFGYKWIKLHKINCQVKSIEYLLYGIHLASAIYLSFDVDIYTANFVLLANFLLFCFFALIITIICAGNSISKVYVTFFASITSFFIFIGYLSYTGDILNHSFLMSLAHLFVNLLVLFFCFSGLRYGYNELMGFFHKHTLGQFNIVRDLPRALSDEELFVEYQPQVSVLTGKAVGVEVLVRWQHPTRGRIPPNDFISLAESMQIIDSLTQWVVTKAVVQAKALQNNDTPVPISVNFSPLNFNFKMIEFLEETLQQHDLPSNLITVEMTENLLLEKSDEVTESLNKLHALGIAVSIDDYGKGYSSLSYLRKMSIDELKIDRSFIMDIQSNKDNYEIVRSTLDMAKNLSIHVVAEGVEDSATQEVLKSIQCNTIQGFGIAKPMSAEKLMEWIAKRNA